MAVSVWNGPCLALHILSTLSLCFSLTGAGTLMPYAWLYCPCLDYRLLEGAGSQRGWNTVPGSPGGLPVQMSDSSQVIGPGLTGLRLAIPSTLFSYLSLITSEGALCSTGRDPLRPKTPTQGTHSRGKVARWLVE